MKAFRKQINESFFNPLFHFIPILLFLLLNENFGCSIALIVVYFVAVAILGYSLLLYKNIYKYLGVSYLVSTFIISILIFFPQELIPNYIQPIFNESVTLVFFSAILVLQTNIIRFVSKWTPKHIAMTNNIEEHFRIVWMVSGVLFVYIIAFLTIKQFISSNIQLLQYLHITYWTILFIVISYEFIRVILIRTSLQKEEWWPIVNEHGKLAGSIQSKESISGETKHIHPVVRGILINDSKIFLQKRSCNASSNAFKWDVALSNHIRLNETVDECINRTAIENYGSSQLKPILISKHLYNSTKESQFVYLFLICNLKIDDTNSELIECVKWWTIHQIEDNLQSGIFTNSFVKEFDILKRSGLLDSNSHECSCQLKETVFKGLDKKI